MKPRDKTRGDLTPAAAYDTAIRLLGRRGHGRRELQLKLRQRGYAEAAIDEALTRCEAHNYIDEAATCESYCRELIRKGRGPRAIRQRLAQRGFDRGLIDATLAAHYPATAIQATARAVADRKADQLKARHKAAGDLRTRLARFLTQRGFPSDVVHQAIDHTMEAAPREGGLDRDGR